MGVPPHLVVPDPPQYRPSLPSPSFSPDSCATPLSLSVSDSSSSSFSQRLPRDDSSSSSFSQRLPRDADPASNILKVEEKPQQRQQQIAVLDMNVSRKSYQVTKSSSKEPFRERKTASTSCTTRVSVPKACCRNVGAFAADCAAVSCCPLAVLSLLSFVVIDLPSALARKIVIHLQRRLCMKDAASARSIRGRDHSLSIFTPSWSYREASERDQEEKGVSVIRFSTQSLLEHFEAENVGFGCLSEERR